MLSEGPQKMKKLLILAFLSISVLIGCKDKYQEGYQVGYMDGVASMDAKVRDAEKRLEDQKRQSNYSLGYGSTEVCGGGVNLNGKYYSGGKTGCVRIFNDGRVEKY